MYIYTVYYIVLLRKIDNRIVNVYILVTIIIVELQKTNLV